MFLLFHLDGIGKVQDGKFQVSECCLLQPSYVLRMCFMSPHT